MLTQHHTADNGDGWVVLIEIKDGRIKRVRGFDEHGNGKTISKLVGKIIKVHKDNNKITVVGTKRTCTYFVKTNQLICFPK